LARYNAENGARIPMSDANTDMALTRTRMAAERTLMAWIRTAFSMISFGFTIGMFFQYLNQQQHSGGPAGRAAPWLYY
jgi:putative membrane protein